MAEEGRVEIIIRKQPSFNMPSFNFASTGKFWRYALVVLIILALGFGVYKFAPAATAFVLSGFGESFDYTITAKATETFKDIGQEDITFTETSGSKSVTMDSLTDLDLYLYNGDELVKETTFSAAKGNTVTLMFDYFDGGGTVKVLVNGAKVFSDVRITMKGVQLKYEAVKEQTAERTAVQEGSAKVSRNGNVRKIIEVTAVPEKVREDGTLGATSYTVTTNNEKVEGYVEDGWMYVKYKTEAAA